MDFDYKILPDKGLLVQQFRVNYCMNTYKKYLTKLIHDPHWLTVTKTLTDIRGVESDVDYKQVYELAELRTNVIARPCKTVILVDQPVATAKAVVYKGLLENRGYDYHFGSTLANALVILHLSHAQEEIEDVLNSFKQ